MTELTTKQIGEQLRRPDADASTLQNLMHAIAQRRRRVRARLAEIEGTNAAERKAATAAGDMDRLYALNRECEQLDDELGVLCDFESRTIQLHGPALERESLAAGQRDFKRLSKLIEAAATAQAAYESAREQLTNAISHIGAARGVLAARSRDGAKPLEVDDATVERILAALFDARYPADRLGGARSGIRRNICAAPSPIYADGPPDLAGQVHDLMHSPFARRDRGV